MKILSCKFYHHDHSWISPAIKTFQQMEFKSSTKFRLFKTEFEFNFAVRMIFWLVKPKNDHDSEIDDKTLHSIV